MPEESPVNANRLSPHLRLVAWEITKRCNLACAHCRAASDDTGYDDELSAQECFGVVDSIASAGTPILILTGGEPLLHPNVVEIAGYAVSRGLRVVLGTNGTLITPDLAGVLRDVPISRVGVSLDFPVGELQDGFRGVGGAFDRALRGIEACRQAGIEVQVNSTITKLNVSYLDDLLGLALDLGAVAFHPFMLVPNQAGAGTGRARATRSRGPGRPRGTCLPGPSSRWNPPRRGCTWPRGTWRPRPAGRRSAA